MQGQRRKSYGWLVLSCLMVGLWVGDLALAQPPNARQQRRQARAERRNNARQNRSTANQQRREVRRDVRQTRTANRAGRREVKQVVRQQRTANRAGRREVKQVVRQQRTANRTGRREVKQVVRQTRAANRADNRQVRKVVRQDRAEVRADRRVVRRENKQVTRHQRIERRQEHRVELALAKASVEKEQVADVKPRRGNRAGARHRGHDNKHRDHDRKRQSRYSTSIHLGYFPSRSYSYCPPPVDHYQTNVYNQYDQTHVYNDTTIINDQAFDESSSSQSYEDGAVEYENNSNDVYHYDPDGRRDISRSRVIVQPTTRIVRSTSGYDLGWPSYSYSNYYGSGCYDGYGRRSSYFHHRPHHGYHRPHHGYGYGYHRRSHYPRWGHGYGQHGYGRYHSGLNVGLHLRF